MTQTCLAVDCMGGDHGPSVTLPACKAFLDAHPDADQDEEDDGEVLIQVHR